MQELSGRQSKVIVKIICVCTITVKNCGSIGVVRVDDYIVGAVAKLVFFL